MADLELNTTRRIKDPQRKPVSKAAKAAAQAKAEESRAAREKAEKPRVRVPAGRDAGSERRQAVRYIVERMGHKTGSGLPSTEVKTGELIPPERPRSNVPAPMQPNSITPSQEGPSMKVPLTPAAVLRLLAGKVGGIVGGILDPTEVATGTLDGNPDQTQVSDAMEVPLHLREKQSNPGLGQPVAAAEMPPQQPQPDMALNTQSQSQPPQGLMSPPTPAQKPQAPAPQTAPTMQPQTQQQQAPSGQPQDTQMKLQQMLELMRSMGVKSFNWGDQAFAADDSAPSGFRLIKSNGA